MILEEIAKAIEAHNHNFEAFVDRNGLLHVTYSESVTGGVFSSNRATVRLTLKVED